MRARATCVVAQASSSAPRRSAPAAPRAGPRPASVSHVDGDRAPPSLPQRAALAAAAAALAAALSGAPAPAAAAAAGPAEPAAATAAAVTPVYFGNGCFWGRQFDFAQLEQRALGRPLPSALAGYAGGRAAGPGGRVCYYYTAERGAVYEPLGHAEVVQVELAAAPASPAGAAEFRRFADVYFSQFRRLPGGAMLRLDPQDAGPGYRSVVGLPGGVASPLFPVLQAANVHGMRLAAGAGGGPGPDGRPLEGDELNTVWVVDSSVLPFHPAEQYHQFHDEVGRTFPRAYKELKKAAAAAGRVGPTGCPEVFFMG
jgi:peptide methionine sulfoxide reductase MsrA